MGESQGHLFGHPIGDSHCCVTGLETDAFVYHFVDPDGKRDIFAAMPPGQLVRARYGSDPQVEVSGQSACGVEVLNAVTPGETVRSISPRPSGARRAVRSRIARIDHTFRGIDPIFAGADYPRTEHDQHRKLATWISSRTGRAAR